MPTNYMQQRFVFMALDPVHIGAGGYRLGRVDSTIIREPGTNLPKIPGTSLAGAARSYAAMLYERPYAAGQHKEFDRLATAANQPNKDNCAIIYTFGTATDNGGGRAGTVSLSDARLLFMPITTQLGPVWLTTKILLQEVWGAESLKLDIEPGDVVEAVAGNSGRVVTTFNVGNGSLNLGWLLVPAEKGISITPPGNITKSKAWQAIKDNIVVTTPRLFSQIVNSNLEVRTSVSIDQTTGAAQSGALFTYEALPRTAWLWSDVVEDIYNTSRPFSSLNDPKKTELKHSRPLDIVRAGLELINYLGVGGMGTRGFGRVSVVGDWEVAG